MRDWQIAVMSDDAYQSESNARRQQWEEINAPDPNQGRMNKAVESLTTAISNLGSVIDWIYQAVDDVDGLPIADKIESYEDTISDIKFSLESLKNELRYGWR